MNVLAKALITAFNGAVKLIEMRKKRQDRHYEKFVEICYHNAQIVRDDFMSIFKENERIIEDTNNLNYAINHLNEQREITFSKRDFIRANLGSIDESELTEFEIGLKRLVIGHDFHALKNNQIRLEVLVDRMRSAEDKESLDRYINHALYINQASIAIVERSWTLINIGYSKYKAEYLKR